MPIERLKEREIIARLRIEMSRESARAYFPGTRLADHRDIELVGAAVFLGHARGRPMGVSEIARHIEMPRATVRRKLADLMKAGLTVKKGRVYCVHPDKVNYPPALRMARRNVMRVLAAAKELAKMGR